MGTGIARFVGHLRESRSLTAGLVAGLLLAVAGSVSAADTNVTYNGCENVSTGVVRLLNNTNLTPPYNECLTSNVIATRHLPAGLAEVPVSWNQVGPQGAAGQNGQSAVITALAPGSANCPTGGSQFAVGAVTTYACNGAPGAVGKAGADGKDGAAGPAGPAGPATLAPAYAEYTTDFGLGSLSDDVTAPTTIISKTLPAGNYLVTFTAGFKNNNAPVVGDSSRDVFCHAINSAAAETATVHVDGYHHFGYMSATQPLGIGAQTTVNVDCWVQGVSTANTEVEVFQVWLVALKVDSIS